MSHPLDGPRARAQRAREHLDTFRQESGPFRGDLREGEAYRIVSKREHRDGKEWVVRTLAVIRPIPVLRLGVLVGDVVHQCRAALDNLVEQATISHTGHSLPRTEFPVHTDASKFAESTRKGDPAPSSGLFAIRGISPAARAVVEKLQPYQRPAGSPPGILGPLHEFWNMDKHRVPAVVGGASFVTHTFFGAGMGLSGPRTIEENIVFPFEDGVNVGRVELLPGETEEDVKMQMDVTVQILFGDGPLSGHEVLDVLDRCVLFTTLVIEQDFRPLFP